MRAARVARLSLLGFLLASGAVSAQVVCPGGASTWTGGGGDTDWFTPGNWSPVGPPLDGSDICFNTVATPNLSAAFIANTITFLAGANVTITSDPFVTLTVNAGINRGAGGFTISPETLVLGASQSWLLNTGSPSIINSPLAGNLGTETITKTGTGGLTLAGPSASFGGIDWTGSTLTVTADNGLGSGTPVTLRSGAILLSAATPLNLGNDVTIAGNATFGVSSTVAGTRHGLGVVTIQNGVTATQSTSGVTPSSLQVTGLTLNGTATLLKTNNTGGLWVAGPVSDSASSTINLRIGFTAPTGPQLDQGIHFTSSATVASTLSSIVASNSALLGADGATTLTFNGSVTLGAAGRLVLIPRTGGTILFNPSGFSAPGNTFDVQLRGDSTGTVRFLNSAVNANGVSIFDGLTFETNAAPPPTVTFSTNAGSTWRIRTSPQTLTGALNMGANATVDTGTDLTLSTAALAGAGLLTKSGGGALTLGAGAHTHTGGFNVTAGRLVVNGSLTGEGNVSIGNGGALSGSGTLSSIGGPITVANGGNFTPGAGGSGTLSTSGLSLSDTSNVTFTVGSSTTRGAVTGALILDGVLTINSGAGFGQGTYTIFTATGQITNNDLRLPILNAPAGFTYGYQVVAGSPNTVLLKVGPAATAVELVGFDALTGRGSTQVTWEAGTEIRNLGYRLYREQGGRRVQVTPGLIAGSALRAGFDPVAGRNYAFTDANGSLGSRYWLEAIDMKGHGQWFGPVEARAGTASGKQFEQAMLLANVGSSTLLASTGPVGKPVDPSGYTRSWNDPSLASQWNVAASKAVKMLVRQDGVYRVSADALFAAGLPAGSPLASIQLWAGGRQVAFRALATNGSTLQSGDALEFFGQAADTRYTDTRIYWVTAGLGTATSIDVVAAAQPSSYASSFLETLEIRDRSLHVAGFVSTDTDGFFGKPIIGNAPMIRTFSTPAIDLTSVEAAVLEVSFQGLTDGEHAVDVKVNGTTVGTVRSAFQDVAKARFTVPPGLLLAGDNDVTLVAQSSSEIALELSQRLTYPRMYAFSGPLRFTAPGGALVQLQGSAAPGAHVLDVTAAPLPVALTATPGNGAASVTVPGRGVRVLFAYRDQDILTPTVLANTPSSWHSAGGADLVIIAAGALLPSLQPLADQRTREGLRVALVDMEDVYDEFSAGMKDATAIRSFLAHASASWSTAPRYLLLAGAATYDPRGWGGHPELDQVPTLQIQTRYSQTASDDALVTFRSGDGPAMAVGRLPLSTSVDMDAAVAKILNRKLPGTDSSLLFVRDMNDASTSFADAVAEVRSGLSMWKSQELARNGDDTTTRTALIDALKTGPFAVDYHGHGAEDLWAGRILTSSDADALANSGNPTLLVAATCLNGYFLDIGRESLGAALLRIPQGGAWGVWASSGFTIPPEHVTLSKVLLTGVLDQGLTLGDATLAGKRAVTDPDVRATFLLLGDPSARATVARSPALTTPSTPRSGASGCGTPGGPIAGASPLVLLVLALVTRRRSTRSVA